MQIRYEYPNPNSAVLRPEGRMDVESSSLVRQAILDIASDRVKLLVVDLSQVEFMDSSGLSALVSGMKALRKSGGELRICKANPQIQTALRLTMLDRVFPVFSGVEEALSAPPNEGIAI